MRPTYPFIAIGLALTLCAAAPLHAEPVAPDKVVFKDNKIAKSLTGKPGDPAAGRKWMINRKLGNCLACHKNAEMSEQLFHGEVAPPLDGAGSRWNEAQLRAIITNAKKVFGNQSLMPAFYRAGDAARTLKKFKGKTILKPQQVEDIIAYVLTLKDKK